MKTHWKYNWREGKWDQLLRGRFHPPQRCHGGYIPGGLYWEAVW